MNYQLIINDSTVLSGNVWTATIIIVLALVILVVMAGLLLRRIRQGEAMRYEFITMIAHKFRTPLTSIKWLLESMVSSEIDPQKKENLSDLVTSNEKLIALTGTMVELTDLDNQTKSLYSWETIPFCDFVRSVFDQYKNAFHEKNIFISLQCSDPDLLVTIDRSRMEFVLQTLFENSCNYTPTGKNVDVTVVRKGRKAVLSVTDNGIGIDNSDLPKIFSKFFRTENARRADTEGIGVGLFLAKSIVRRHHGHMVVYSAGINQGSTFTLTLPSVRK